MKIIEKIEECRKTVEKLKSEGKIVGLVPTMGSLHRGHLSLIKMALRACDKVFVSIFVNPAQFGPGEDFEKYPGEPVKDRELAEKSGADYLYHPAVPEMYRPGHRTFVEVEGLGKIMCGISRPSHFRGVATVVTKLFNIIPAHKAYFGEKDYQQLVIIRKMVLDLNIDVEIISGPTIREEDGLAMSSRNRYLSGEQRKEANIIYETLRWAGREVGSGRKDLESIRSEALERILEKRNVKEVEYFDFRDALTLEEIANPCGHGKILVATAVRIGETRLIDNIVISMKK